MVIVVVFVHDARIITSLNLKFYLRNVLQRDVTFGTSRNQSHNNNIVYLAMMNDVIGELPAPTRLRRLLTTFYVCKKHSVIQTTCTTRTWICHRRF